MGERQNYTKSFIITSNTKSGSLPPLLVSIQRRVVTQLWGVIIRLGPDTGRRGECTLTHISCCCLISKQTHSSPHMCLSYWQPSPPLTPTPFNRHRLLCRGTAAFITVKGCWIMWPWPWARVTHVTCHTTTCGHHAGNPSPDHCPHWQLSIVTINRSQ